EKCRQKGTERERQPEVFLPAGLTKLQPGRQGSKQEKRAADIRDSGNPGDTLRVHGMDRKENSAPECHPGRMEQKPADPEHQKCGSKMQPDVDPMIDSGLQTSE